MNRNITKLISILFAMVLAFSVCVCAFASGDRLNDEAGLLSYSEKDELRSLLDDLSEQLGYDIVVVTVNDYTDYGYSSMEEFADEYISDGIVCAISMADRSFEVWDNSYLVTDDGIEKIIDSMLPSLRSGDWYSAFNTYALTSYSLAQQGLNGDVYGTNATGDYDYYAMGDEISYTPPARERFKEAAPKAGVAGIIVGLLSALVTTGSMKSKLTSVSLKRDAASYIVPGSMNVSNQSDVFLYHTVTHTPKPKDDSSSHSGGGSSVHVSHSSGGHGGGGHF